MLKRYTAQDRVHWVGKAWEVRHALRQVKRQSGRETRLADWLSASASPARNREAAKGYGIGK